MLKLKKVISFIFLIISIFIYLLHPNDYDAIYINCCGILFILNIYSYYRLRNTKRYNYFSFISIFTFCYFLITMFFPLFSFGNKGIFEYDFVFGYDKRLISQVTGLGLLGLSSFLFGCNIFEKKIKFSLKIDKKITFYRYYFLSIISYILFFITGGYKYLVDLYAGNQIDDVSNSGNYFLILVPIFLSIGIIIEFYNNLNKYEKFSFKNFSILGYTTTLFIIISIFMTGSRTIPMQIILLILGLYTLIFKPMSLKKFTLFVFMGSFLMFNIALIRGNVESEGFNIAKVLSDLIFNNRTTFIAIEYVNKYDYTYGLSMLGSILSPIPFLQSLVLDLFSLNNYDIGSASLNTFYTLKGDHGHYGAGTNILADIYFSFGGTGVVILMFTLGAFINKINYNSKRNIYYFASYAIMISFAVFLVRADYFFFLRTLLWSLLIIWINLKIK